MENINSRLQLVMKSGKVALGYKETLKNLRNGKGKCIDQFIYLLDDNIIALNSKIGHSQFQYATAAQIGSGILRDACEDWCSPLYWHQQSFGYCLW